MKKLIFISSYLVLVVLTINAQDSLSFLSRASEFNKKRFNTVIATEAILYTSSFVGLNELWYKGYPRSSFHFFNDNSEWLQMDKAGHAVTAYSVGRIGINLMRWTGLRRNRAIWYGGLLGMLYQTTIEMFDGYSSQWGFSWGDMGSNTAGAAILIGQEVFWKEQRIQMKFSFHRTNYAKIRPSILGNNWQESILKDYNGQTLWVSFNVSSFMKRDTHFPKWLNLAFGYGATGMIGGKKNPLTDVNGNAYPTYERKRYYRFAFDADLTRIKTKSKFLKSIFETFGFLKIPAPMIQLGWKEVHFNWFYF